MISSHEKEGYDGRTLELYHMTSSTGAGSIVTQKYMKPGSQGMFGPAIYFAETREACQKKAKYQDALLIAKVKVGVSLICRRADYNLNYQTVSSLGCHSVKGVDCVTSVEYAIYNSVQIIEIKIAPFFPLYITLPGGAEIRAEGCDIQFE